MRPSSIAAYDSLGGPRQSAGPLDKTLSAHEPTALVRKMRRRVVKRAPKKQSWVLGIRAAPLTNSQATQRDEKGHCAGLRHDLADALSMKSPADRALLNDQLEVVSIPSREQLAVESIPSRKQRDEAEHRVQLRHDLVDASSTKSPADRTL